jgi:hypothetical protein
VNSIETVGGADQRKLVTAGSVVTGTPRAVVLADIEGRAAWTAVYAMVVAVSDVKAAMRVSLV